MIYKTPKTYKEYLENEIANLTEKFEDAKKETIREIENMSVHMAETYGAAYYAKIEMITKYAAELMKLQETYRRYLFFMKEE